MNHSVVAVLASTLTCFIDIRRHYVILRFDWFADTFMSKKNPEIEISLQDLHHEKRRRSVSHCFFYFLLLNPSSAVFELTVRGCLCSTVWGPFPWFTLQQQRLGWIKWKITASAPAGSCKLMIQGLSQRAPMLQAGPSAVCSHRSTSSISIPSSLSGKKRFPFPKVSFCF